MQKTDSEEKSPRTIQVTITLAGVLFAATVIWNMSAANTKLNALIEGQAKMGEQMSKFDTGISDLRDRVKSLELYGSPANNSRLDAHDVALLDRDKADVELRTRIEKLTDSFRVHATQKDPLTFPPSGGRKEGDLW